MLWVVVVVCCRAVLVSAHSFLFFFFCVCCISARLFRVSDDPVSCWMQYCATASFSNRFLIEELWLLGGFLMSEFVVNAHDVLNFFFFACFSFVWWRRCGSVPVPLMSLVYLPSFIYIFFFLCVLPFFFFLCACDLKKAKANNKVVDQHTHTHTWQLCRCVASMSGCCSSIAREKEGVHLDVTVSSASTAAHLTRSVHCVLQPRHLRFFSFFLIYLNA